MFLLLVLFLFIAVIVVAVVVDILTGRGIGLGVLSCLLLACTDLAFVATALSALQPLRPGIHPLGADFVLILYFTPAFIANLIMTFAAAIVAAAAGQLRWLGGLVLAVVVPWLLPVLLYPHLSEQAGSIVIVVEFLGMLIVPEVTVLAYGITRSVHPVVRARQSAVAIRP